MPSSLELWALAYLHAICITFASPYALLFAPPMALPFASYLHGFCTYPSAPRAVSGVPADYLVYCGYFGTSALRSAGGWRWCVWDVVVSEFGYVNCVGLVVVVAVMTLLLDFV